MIAVVLSWPLIAGSEGHFASVWIPKYTGVILFAIMIVFEGAKARTFVY